MADTWLGKYSRYLEKLFNAKGGPVVVDVGHQVIPVVQMSLVPQEERYLVGQESFGMGDSQPAVAANLAAFMIRNPIGSNVIVTIEKITCTVGAAAGLGLFVAGSNPADLATAIANHSRADSRTRSIGSAVTSRDAPAVDPRTGFVQLANINVANAVPYDWILTQNSEIVLLPQIALRVVTTAANTALQCTMFWRERTLETSELT